MGKTEREHMAERGFVTVYTAAKWIGWSPNRIYRAIERGDVETKTAGAVTYVSEGSLLDYAGEALAELYEENKAAEG